LSSAIFFYQVFDYETQGRILAPSFGLKPHDFNPIPTPFFWDGKKEVIYFTTLIDI